MLDSHLFLPLTGIPITQGIANPAPGAQFSFNVTGQCIVLITSITFRLQTDANAANRYARILFNDGTRDVIFVQPMHVQTTGLTRDHNFFIGASNCQLLIGGTQYQSSLPSHLWFKDNGTVASSVAGMQAGDQLSNIAISYQRLFYL